MYHSQIMIDEEELNEHFSPNRRPIEPTKKRGKNA